MVSASVVWAGLDAVPCARQHDWLRDLDALLLLSNDWQALRASAFREANAKIATDPELGAVGLTEAEARAQGFAVGVATHPLRAVTRAQYYGTTRGLYKIVYDRATRRVLGVHVVSRGAGNIVGALAAALGLGATVDDLAAVHHVYPSFSEGLKAAAEQAA